MVFASQPLFIYPKLSYLPSSSNSFKMKVLSIFFVMVAMLALLTAEVQVTTAANCDENVLLAECGENLREGGVPSATCCGILRDQQPCICGYPDHNNWPGLPKICGFCDVSFPNC